MPVAQLTAILRGCRHPVVVILLLISFFAAISGKPLDGALTLVVAIPLARDAGRDRPALATTGNTSVREPALATAGHTSVREPALAAAGEAAVHGPAHAARRKRLLAVLALPGGALYALVVGSFIRYSWPATIAVVVVGALAVGRGWRGPVLLRADPGPLPRAGAALWAGLLVAGGLWELFALLRQPSLATSSYAHPTISTLTDPLLAGAPGRALVLAAWLALGWALVRR